MNLSVLKYFPMDIYASSGKASADETREAFGAFLLAHAGYPTEIEVKDLAHDDSYRGERFEFTYKGKVWRFSFIITTNIHTHGPEAFRIHFDYIREA